MKKLFDDLKNNEMIQYSLYDEKYLIGFNEILAKIDDITREKINKNEEKQLERGLNYIYPLLKEGKLKVRLRTFEFEKEVDKCKYYKVIESQEYGKEGVDLVIDEIKKRWKNLKTDKERRDFSMEEVQFILPENKWPKDNLDD